MFDLGGVSMFGQMSIFDFIQVQKFNPLEALALEGTDYENGKQYDREENL